MEYIERTMMEYLRREFVNNTDSASEETCKLKKRVYGYNKCKKY